MKRWNQLGIALLPAALLLWAQSDPAVDGRFFSKTIYPIMQEKNCRGCHVENGVAATTRLHFPPETASAEEVEAFGRSLAALVDREHPERSLLLIKPTNRIAHAGGKLVAPGSKEDAAWIRWVNYVATLPAAPAVPASGIEAKSTGGTAAPEMMRRLTHSQYNNTVRDLLGDQTLPASQFPTEDFVSGFKNQAEAQSVSPLLAEAYSAAAEKLAKNAFRGGDTNGLIPCRPSSAGDAGCRAKFVRAFGLKTFRRPLTEPEQRRYEALFAEEAKRNGQFLAGAQVVVEAMLQAPAFLFRPEKGGKWGQYDLAGRLSYFLWDTMPDAELFQAAAAGELGSKEKVGRQARRMLGDPRARQALDEFVSEWLRFDRVLGTVKDRRLYGVYTPELGVAMTEETRRLIADAVWNDRNFMDIYTAEYGYLNSDLASVYGVPKPTEEFGLVKFTAGPGGHSDRAGILGEGTFLTLTSKPDETSPTARGLFVREQLLCQKIPSPPPGTNMNLAPPEESKPQTTKERLEAHRSEPICKSCHGLLDPIGFGLEKYDAIGRRREKQTIVFIPTRAERGKRDTTAQLPLEGKGAVAGIPNSAFSSPRELGAILAADEQCQECVVKQLFRYAFGRQEAPADHPAIQGTFEAFRDSQFRFKELMIALVTSKEFRGVKD